MILDILAWVVVAGALLGVALFMAAPIVIHRVQTQPIEHEILPLEADHLHPEAERFLAQERFRLLSLDFESLGVAGMAGDAQVSTVFELFRHPEEPICAMTALISAVVEDRWQFMEAYTELVTELEDGRQITVNNAKTHGPYPLPKGHILVQRPDLREPQALFDLHRRILDHVDTPSAADFGGRAPFEWIGDQMREEGQRLTRWGYLRPAPDAGVYRLTWKGAILVTYRVVPPFKVLWRRYREGQAARALRALGFGGR